MKRLAVSTIALALVLSSPVAAQDGEAAAEARIRADVSFLADDAIEGRRAGQRGYDLAALYVRTRMEAMGLTAGGPDGAWLQPMTLAAMKIAPEGATVTWTPQGGAPVVWTHGTQLSVTPGADAGHVTQSAELVFVGYGLDAPELGMDDYAGLDVRGKIVVVLSGVPTGLTGEPAAYLGDSKRRAAAAHGAIGYISLPKSDQALAAFGRAVAGAARQTSRTWVGADGKPHVDATGVIVGASVGPEAGEALFAGAPKSYAEIRAEAAGQGGRPKGFALAGSAAFDVPTVREDVLTANVVGRIEGSDPVLKDEVVLLSAHLDHLGISETGEDRINNGALDNAGGVSIMLEAARSLAATPPRRSVLVVALTAEEMGLIGSDFIARNPVVAADKVVANVNLDMPILTYDFTDLVAFGSDHSTLGPLVDRAARTENLTLSPDPMPEQGVFTRSDHYSFVKAGVPSVMLATGYANGGEAQWDAFFANGYHRPSDDLSMPFNWAAATRFARVNAAIARAIADDDQRPLWYQGDVFGDRFAARAQKAPTPSTE
ncbi:M28 family metallopeptidase [Brevundimonas sp. NPDC092305]|uniref:M28 family metallopeptidase n=1 Tax=Brevundimonas sp. NPDC092305 TaxID=3363957 RepID=UPI0037F3759A